MGSKFCLTEDSARGYFVSRKKLLWITLLVVFSLLCICIIAVVATYLSMRQDSPLGTSERHLSGMKFDLTSLYKNIFASRNMTFISNRYFPDSIAGPGTRALTVYRGTMLNRYVTKNQELQFDVDIWYEITADVSYLDLVFDISLCRLADIDRSVFGGKYCWSMHAFCDNETGIAIAFEDPTHAYEQKTISLSSIGTKKNLLYKILVRGPQNSMSFVNRETGATVTTITTLNFTVPLYPVFGLYQRDKFASKLSIL